MTPSAETPSAAPSAPAANPAPAPAPETTWFTDDRFGMFVHWGLYSLAARHEWVKNREKLTDEQYQVYFDHFDPDRYDPAQWARAARAAGMRYVVLTTKHHDGFCLWDSALTEYKVTNTPHGRDLVGPFVEACRAEGLKVGLYYSLIDWHHPSFPVDGTHPQRDDEEFKAAAADRDIREYRSYLHGQVRELLTSFGRIDYLFFDFSYAGRIWWGGKGPDDWDSPKLLETVRELQPHILVNDRTGLPGDFITPEQYQPSGPMTKDGRPVLWEACQTLNGSWGYDRDNLDHKSADLLIRMLVDGVSKGGNLLLNVGPTGRGDLEPRATAVLGEIGRWVDLHERSVRGCGPAPYTAPPECRYTQRGDRLYVHLLAWPLRHLHLPGLAGRVRYAQLLNDASEIIQVHIDPDRPAMNTEMGGQPAGTLTLEIPVQRPDTPVPVIELFLDTPADRADG
ncbi:MULTISPECIES: alpha-L-fucosidase [unclassified Streptomyces]|uniref:alpha-L-fucosidase n=1 Tax=unclassified Streptomyces TaxID=2593676 RepID=UPI002252573C|nr:MULTISPECIES: alpha-L-fucosidase [unclassified Streptomyces]MCX4862610.1 alpha-L-fucosidase [Streptomyces sp. NBC_00906]MCX4893847.1 alpha-L-fucosidase [Streptomyces sp. NBC_00892]